MKNKNIAYGTLFILLAAYLIVNKLGLIPHIPFIKIAISCILAYVSVKGLLKMEFFQFFVPLAFIGWQYDSLLGIEKLTPWTLIFTACLLAIGCEFIFQSKKSYLKRWIRKKGTPGFSFEFDSNENSNSNGVSNFQTVMKEDGEYISIENGIGETTRYIDSNHLKYVEIDNGLGKCLVYFNNCTIVNEATIEIDNGVGRTDIYIPNNWRIDLKSDNGLGSTHLNGEPSQNPYDPLVHINVDNGLGNVEVTVAGQ